MKPLTFWGFQFVYIRFFGGRVCLRNTGGTQQPCPQLLCTYTQTSHFTYHQFWQVYDYRQGYKPNLWLKSESFRNKIHFQKKNQERRTGSSLWDMERKGTKESRHTQRFQLFIELTKYILCLSAQIRDINYFQALASKYLIDSRLCTITQY